MKKFITLIITALSFVFCFSQSSVWKIGKNGNTLYLGGSIHLLRAEDYPLPQEFDATFAKSELQNYNFFLNLRNYTVLILDWKQTYVNYELRLYLRLKDAIVNLL